MIYIVIETKKIWRDDPYGKHPNDRGWEEEVQVAHYFESYSVFAKKVSDLTGSKTKFRAFEAEEFKITTKVETVIEKL